MLLRQLQCKALLRSEKSNCMQLKYLNFQNTPIYLIGDLHSKYADFYKLVDSDYTLKDCVFIFLGDFGICEYKPTHEQIELDSLLTRRNIDGYVIRGEQDNPELWLNSPAQVSFWKNFYALKPIGSNTRININENIGLIISGALTELAEKPANESSYTEIDMPSDLVDYGECLKNVDFIIGHCGPVYSDIFKNSSNDEHEKCLAYGLLSDKFEDEQKQIRSILKRYNPKRWYCGHYHMNKDIKFVWDNWSDDGIIALKIVDKLQIYRIA